jgi:hypothetical protein
MRDSANGGRTRAHWAYPQLADRVDVAHTGDTVSPGHTRTDASGTLRSGLRGTRQRVVARSRCFAPTLLVLSATRGEAQVTWQYYLGGLGG